MKNKRWISMLMILCFICSLCVFADADSVEQAIRDDEGIGKKHDLALITEKNINPDIVDINEDGSLILNGYVPTLTIAVSFGRFAAGTYTAAIQITGDISPIDTNVSLRYGKVGDGQNNQRWVNVVTPCKTITLSGDEKTALVIKAGTTLKNVRIRLTITEVPESTGSASMEDITLQQELLDAGLTKMMAYNRKEPCLNFALITDTHCAFFPEDYYSCTNNIDLFRKVCAFVDFGVHCGDVVVSTEKTKEEAIAEWELWDRAIEGAECPIYIAKGNHELNARWPTQETYDYDKDHSQFITNEEFNVRAQIHAGRRQRNLHDPDGSYYYVDYEDFGVRIIILNAYRESTDDLNKEFGEEQLRWFAEQALDFSRKEIPSNWTSIIFVHTLEGNESPVIGKLLDGFISGNAVTELPEFDTAHFTRQGPMLFVGVISGHHHDDVYTNQIDGSERNINSIIVDNSFTDTQNRYARFGYILDELGTENEYCVSLFSLDVNNHILYETRLGRIGFAEYIGDEQGRYGYTVRKTDPATEERKTDRSFSYGLSDEENRILSGIDDHNRNVG